MVQNNKRGRRDRKKTNVRDITREVAKLARIDAKQLDQEKNQKILDRLLPLLSNKIDEAGGVMRVIDLAHIQELKDLLDEIPPRFPKSLPLILAQWGDFFVNMPNGLVGTAVGYETGMINEDGTLEPAYASTFVDANGFPLDANYDPAKGVEIVDLTEKADNLWRAALNMDNDFDMKAAFRDCEATRRHIRGEDSICPLKHEFGIVPWSGVPPPNPKKLKAAKAKGAGTGPEVLALLRSGPLNLAEKDRCMKKEKILHRIVEILLRSPNYTKNMCLIVSDPSIRELKKGAIRRKKFLKFLQEFPKMFRLVNVEGTPRYDITLLDRHVPIIKPHGAHITTTAEQVQELIGEY